MKNSSLFLIQLPIGFLLSVLNFVHLSWAQQQEKCVGPSAYCVCSIPRVLSDFSNIIVHARSPAKAIQHITQYRCPVYKKLPPELTISLSDTFSNQQNGQYSYRSRRRKRQIALGHPDPHLFSTAIAHLKTRAAHQYVPLGSSLVLPCFSSDDLVEDTYGLEKRFTWRHSDGSPVTAPQV